MTEAHSIPALGRLETIDLRQVWTSEPYAFTPWLAQPENLQFLGNELGMPGLELVTTEHPVDIFFADIVARAPESGELVLIENQIERSDHTHLGQILTYTAGLNAAIIVWVARQFAEGHRAALDWLNRVTPDEYAFFGIEVEAVRIGESLPAPRFNVVARPNGWSRSVRAAARSADGGPDAQKYEAFWKGYDAKALEIGAPIRAGAKPVRSTNYYVRIKGFELTYLAAFCAPSQKSIGVYLTTQGVNGRDLFEALKSKRPEIEARFGGPLEWIEPKTGSSWVIHAGRLDAPFDDADWPRQQLWLAERMKRLEAAIQPALDAVASHQTP